jgi:subtilisin family serine protease
MTSKALNAAIAAVVAKGVTVVVAAGNKGVDACKASPASAPNVISVGATNKEGALAPYSNFGPCVRIFAPGSEVVSAWHTSDTATKTLSGTSMASPSVAGLAALALETMPEASPLEVATFLVDHARHSRVAASATNAPTGLLAWMDSALADSADTQTLALKAMATLSAAPGSRTR